MKSKNLTQAHLRVEGQRRWEMAKTGRKENVRRRGRGEAKEAGGGISFDFSHLLVVSAQ